MFWNKDIDKKIKAKQEKLNEVSKCIKGEGEAFGGGELYSELYVHIQLLISEINTLETKKHNRNVIVVMLINSVISAIIASVIG